MKSQILLALAGAFGASALVPRSEAACSNPKCQTVAQILKQAKQDPLIPLKPDVAQFPCDMGTKIPKGDVPTGCADLEIIAARGTSEPGNLGVVVADPLVARVKRDLPGVKVRGYPVQYNADLFGASTGVADVKSRLTKENTECPNQKYVLVGYSQGGMVISSSLSGIPAAIVPKIVAVVLYGAGDGSSVSAKFKSKTLANCAPGDFACTGSGSPANNGPYCTVGHVSYNTEGTVWHDRSSQYIVTAYKGTAPGHKTARTPTGSL